jgi:hypothetical protein
VGETAHVKAVAVTAAVVVVTATAGRTGVPKEEATPAKVAKPAQTCVAKAATNPGVTTEPMKAVWMVVPLAPIALQKAVVDAVEAIAQPATTRAQRHYNRLHQSPLLKAPMCRQKA